MKPPLHILVLCYEYPPIGGGGGVGAQQYAEAWAAAGHSVTVVTSADRGLARRETVAGVEIVRVAAPGKRDRATATNLSMFSYLVSGTAQILRRLSHFRGFDVINTHFAIPTGPLGRVAAWLIRRPNVLTIIGGDIYDPSKSSSPHRHALLRFANTRIINGATRVIAISGDTRARALEHYRVTREIQVVNYGFHPSPLVPTTRAELGLDPDKFYLIAVGRLVKRKGFEYLLDAMAGLPAQVELLLIGDGPLAEALGQQSRRLGIERRVHALGFLPRDSILRHLSVADCFVLSSLHEGLGIVVQEAMYVGLPIVATNHGGQVDLVHDGRNGLLVEPCDVPGLRRGIERIHADPALAAAMREHNRHDIQRLYMASNAEEYISVFRQTLAS